MKRILIDMDEVMADVIPKFEAIYEREMGRKISKEEYYGRKIYESPDAKHLRDFLHEKGFFADLPVMPGCREVIQELMETYEIFIVTSAMEFKFSFEDKYNWLRKNFPFIHWRNFVFCGQKGMIKGDYMIDDHVRNVENFEGHGLLFTASHNVHEQRFTRVNNWEEVHDFFKIAEVI